MSTRLPIVRLGFGLVILIGVVACGGRTESIGGGSSAVAGGGGTDPNGVDTCTAAPACDYGYQPLLSNVVFCPGDSECYERTTCGQTVLCARSNTECGGFPSCAPGYTRVPYCTNYDDCFSDYYCGVQISCARDPNQCDGYPVCDPGHKEIGSPSQCLQDDAACYTRYACGITIWCTGPFGNDAGSGDGGVVDASVSDASPPPPPGP